MVEPGGNLKFIIKMNAQQKIRNKHNLLGIYLAIGQKIYIKQKVFVTNILLGIHFERKPEWHQTVSHFNFVHPKFAWF